MPTAPRRSPRVAKMAQRDDARLVGGEARAPPVHEYGEPWWLDDPNERNSDQSKGRAKQWALLLGLWSACVAAAVWLSRSGALTWLTTPAEVAASPLVSPEALAGWRAAAAALVVVSSMFQHWQPWELMPFENLDRTRDIYFRHGGPWRWQGLTYVAWALLGAYFSVAAKVSLDVLASPGAAANAQPSSWACAAQLLLGVGTAYAYLVTVVVTFVLIPGKEKRGRSTDPFFNTHALIQHNANLAIVVVELLVSGMHVNPYHLPFAVCFGLTYVIVWHQGLRWHITHTLLYFFLDWTHPHSSAIVVGLVCVLSSFFGFGWAVAELLRPTQWGPALVVGLALAVLRVRR